MAASAYFDSSTTAYIQYGTTGFPWNSDGMVEMHMSAWVRPGDQPAAHAGLLACNPSTNGGGFWILVHDDGDFLANVSDSGAAANKWNARATGKPLVQWVWQFASWQWAYNSGSPAMDFWINGVSTGTDFGASEGTTAQIRVSGEQTTQGQDLVRSSAEYNGQIAHMQVYDRLLTENEVNEIMHRPGTITDGLVAHWPNTSTEYLDLSGNGYTGTDAGAMNVSTQGPPDVFYSGGSV